MSAAAQDLHAWPAAKQPSFWELLASSVPAVWGSLPRCATTYMICSCRYFSIVLWCPLTRRTGGRVVTDGNSGFFTTYDNVVADSPGALWLSVNSCKPPPNRIYDCYVDNASFHNETLMNCDCSPDPSKSGNCTATNITIVPDSAAWPAAAKAIMGSAGP